MQTAKMTASRFGATSLRAAALCFLLICLLLPSPAAAQTEPLVFEDTKLWIYPEYDDPRLLVMLEGRIVDAQPPLDIRFLVPEAAEMYSAGSMSPDGEYSGGPPERQTSSIAGWDEIGYELTTSVFRVEYYLDSIPKGSEKALSSHFIPLVPISGLRVYVQEPRQSSGFSAQAEVSPSAYSQDSDVHGMTLHIFDYLQVEAQQDLAFDLSYTKTNPNPSLRIITGLRDVGLWLYPEYDDPRLLVKIEGTISGAIPPAPIDFLVPEGSQIFLAGSVDEEERYAGGSPQRDPSEREGWDEISYDVTTSRFRVEYYQDAIEGRSEKSIVSQFIPLLPISGMKAYIQEPRQSSDFKVTPMVSSAKSVTQLDDGFSYHVYEYGALDAEQPLRFAISYVKSNPLPSLEIEEGSTSLWPWLGGGLAAAVLAIGGVVYVVLSRRRVLPAVSSTTIDSRDRRPPAQQHCTECGARLDSSFRFCPQCGTRLGE